MSIIVSAYFKIKSKFPHEVYKEHLTRFFTSIQGKVVFFTTKDVYDEFSFIPNTKNIHFVFLQFHELEAFKKYSIHFWKHHSLKDPENHSESLAAVWYEKPHFVLRACKLFPNYKNYIWCDAGCIREDISEQQLTNFGSRYTLTDHYLHLQHIYPRYYKDYYQEYDVYIAGAIMFGSPQAWKQHVKLYNQVLKEYHLHNQYVSKDQHLIQSCVDKKPQYYMLHEPDQNLKVDRWFFFLQYI